MSNTIGKPGVRAQQRNALDRILFLEQAYATFSQSVSTSYSNLDKNVGELVEIVSALVRVVGAEEVARTLTDIQSEKAAKEVAEGKESLQKRIDAGELVPGTVVTPESVIVGRELDTEGNEIAPGYVQLDFPTVKPEYQTKLLAVSVGDQIETEAGRKFEVQAVYYPAEAGTEIKAAE